MNKLKILISVAAIIICSIGCRIQSREAVSQVAEQDQMYAMEEAKEEREDEGLLLRAWYAIPMQADYLSHINDRRTQQWVLLYSNRDPHNGMICYISYNVLPDEVHVSGGAWRDEVVEFEARDFPSRTFLGLIEYIGEHPDVFFDHSEFDGQEAGSVRFPEGYIEGFSLDVGTNQRVDDRGVYYVIKKAVMPGEEVPEELRYVLDTIRIEFAEVIAGRTIPRPE